MNALDFSPLFRPPSASTAWPAWSRPPRAADGPAYPPYNIEKTGEDSYVLTMAVGRLRPERHRADRAREHADRRRQGAAAAGDTRACSTAASPAAPSSVASCLADHIVVEGAQLENGLLHVALRREVPEALKPRRIAIAAGAPRPALPSNNARGGLTRQVGPGSRPGPIRRLGADRGPAERSAGPFA
jgi:molecular chaperone IbpA